VARNSRAIAAAALGLALVANPAFAQDDDRALSQFARPPAAAPRGEPVLGVQWERALRAPDRFGPPVLREADAQLLAAAREARWSDALQLMKSGKAGANATELIPGRPSPHVLAMAARAGQDDLLRELIKRGADIDRAGEDGFTALGAAAFAGRRSSVRLLLLAGADLSRQGASGQTALHLASLAGQLDVIEEMLRLKVNLEVLNRQRETALDVAANAGQQEVMGRLIEAGADANAAGHR
jgi:Ankyrin repeats (3 copies)